MLEILNKENLNEEELSFVNLHNKILANAQMTGVYLYEFCKELKEMRDSKKYIYAGLSNFEEYAINELGLKKSQAYNFCSIAENINPEIFQSIGKIGTTKLLLISKLEPEEQEKVIIDNDLEKMTVKDLEDQIKVLKAGNESLQHCYDLLQKDYDELDNDNNELVEEIHNYRKEIAKLKESNSKDEIIKLEAKIKELEANPKVIEKEVIKEDLTKDNKIKELELKIKNLETNKNSSLNQFKIIFDVIKDNITKAINISSTFEEENKNKCLNALRKLIELI